MSDYIRKDVLGFLESTYHEDIKGPDLKVRFPDLSGRSARRYLLNYRRQITRHSSPIRMTAPIENLDAVVFDIETTDFGTEGYIGKLLCCSFLPVNNGHKPHTLVIRYNEQNDRRLIREVAEELARYRYHIGHNIASFDYNWLNSRLMFHGLPTLDTAIYFDTYQVAKSLAIKTSKGLGNLVDYFGLPEVKTAIYRASWSKSLSPYEGEFEETLGQITYHCSEDVKANRQLFNVLHHYALNNGRDNPWKVTKIRGNFWKQHDP